MFLANEAISKFTVKRVLERIAGGENSLTIEQYREHEECLRLIVGQVWGQYRFRKINDPGRQYYEPCWEKFHQATTDEEIIEALEFLRVSIQWD